MHLSKDIGYTFIIIVSIMPTVMNDLIPYSFDLFSLDVFSSSLQHLPRQHLKAEKKIELWFPDNRYYYKISIRSFNKKRVTLIQIFLKVGTLLH